MDPEREKKLNELLVRAVGRPSALRRAFLEGACAGDSALLAEALALLAQEDSLDGFLEEPAAAGLTAQSPEGVGSMLHLKADDGDKREPELGVYRLDRLLGQGGMGEVYKAWDPRRRCWVAIKRLRSEIFYDPRARARFQREARILSRIVHPAIVRIFDLLEEAGDDWIVMELVEGPSLAKLLRGGALTLDLAIAYGRQVASGIAAAHDQGIMHRDLKTENVLVLPSRRVKILDFGLAKEEIGSPGDTSVSIPGQILGTPRVMSPEQVEGLPIDRRSDLFSLGVLLYEILTARSPFQGQWVFETLDRVTTHRPPSVRQLDPRIPEPLSDLVDRLLEKDPGRRGDAAAAALALASIARTRRAAAKSHPTIADRPRAKVRSGGRRL